MTSGDLTLYDSIILTIYFYIDDGQSRNHRSMRGRLLHSDLDILF